MTRKRDLSGFGGGPPAPPKATPVTGGPPPPQPPTEAPLKPPARPTKRLEPATGSEAASKKDKKDKQRITLSLPTSVASLLRSTADRENRIYLDIILEAFLAHSDAADQSFVERRRTGEIKSTGGRRRSDSGRTQIPLNILKEDLGEVDRKAARLGLDRSAYVTELLVRSLGH